MYYSNPYVTGGQKQTHTHTRIWGQLGWCNGIRAQPYALDTAYQWLKHFLYVYDGCMKWSEVDISLKHDIVASCSLLK
jgi:hypothetical protein